MFYIAVILLSDLVIILANAVYSGNKKQEEIEYSKVVTMFQNEEVKRYYVDNTGHLRDEFLTRL